jgi:hypothetical protein
MDNREIARSYVQKADMALSELTSSGGVLQPQQQKEFFRIMIEPTVLLSEINVKPLAGPVELVDKVGFLSRVLRRGSDGQPLTAGDRVKPDLSKLTYTAKEVKTQVNLTDSELEDSIEQGTFLDTIKAMLADATRRDLEDLVVNGDTTSTDPLLALTDGLLKLITTNVVDRNAGSAQTLQLGHFTDSFKGMPNEFLLPDRSQMRFYTAVDAELKWREILGNRATTGGDDWLTTYRDVAVFGAPLRGVPRFPQNLGTGTNETNIVFADPKNISLGVWKDLKWRMQEDIQAGVTWVVGRTRCDVKLRHEPASTKAIHVTF